MTISPHSKIYIAGHQGMVGSALLRTFKAHGYTRFALASRQDLDISNSLAVDTFLKKEKPDLVINAAAKVGGIYANNKYPAEFIYSNLSSALTLTHSAFQNGIKHYIFLGSSCIYPRNAPQPMSENCLLTGPLEETNEPYAIAKIAGLKLCQYYRKQYGVRFYSVMPTNLYGPGDNYHLQNAHVLPALIRKFHEAKINKQPCVTLWGDGTPKREFLHVDDLAAGILHLAKLENPPDWTNIGMGKDVTIHALATLVAKTVGYTGNILFDTTYPNGTPQKLLNIDLIKRTGWKPIIELADGIQKTYDSFLSELGSGTLRT